MSNVGKETRETGEAMERLENATLSATINLWLFAIAWSLLKTTGGKIR